MKILIEQINRAIAKDDSLSTNNQNYEGGDTFS